MSDIQNTNDTNTDTVKMTREPVGLYDSFPGRGIRASVFQNQNRQTGRYYSTVAYTRSYKDENGEWHNSSTLRGWEQSQMSLLVHEASKLQNELDRSNRIVDRQEGLTPDRRQQHQNTEAEQVQSTNGLAAQRDAAIANKAVPEDGHNGATPKQFPQQSQSPEM